MFWKIVKEVRNKYSRLKCSVRNESGVKERMKRDHETVERDRYGSFGLERSR